MNRNKDKRTLGIILIIVGFLGLAVSLTSFTMEGYSIWPIGPMMRGWNYRGLKEVSGAVEKIEFMEVELVVNGEEVELHGPPWFWQRLGIKEGNVVTAKGVLVSMMEPGKGWHQEFIPFELKVNGKTYGDASKGIPVWMQEV
jgi:hypothetical protein